jgi:hypothetical protein
MDTRLFTLFPLILTLGCSGGSKESGSGESESTESAALTGADLAGHWVSGGCEAYDDGQGGKNYLTRAFTLTETTWHLDLAIFGDESCSYALFSAAIDGPLSLGELSTVVDGATNGQFGFQKIVWTAQDQGMADTFTGAGCGAAAWEVGVPQDVSTTGCIGVAHPVADCPEEYDLVGMVDGKLYFGERITDMCSEAGRPKALGAYGLDLK